MSSGVETDLDSRLRRARSRLETGLERTDQTGTLRYARDDWFERLHLQHARTASSELLFRRSVIDARGLPSKLDSWNYSFSTALGHHFSAGVAAGHAVGHFQSARDVSSNLTPRVGFDLVAPARVRLQGDIAAGVEWRRFTGGGLVTIQVSDEAHSVDQTRSFFLSQLDADNTSVLVRASGTGVVYAEGTDYVLTPIGRELRVAGHVADHPRARAFSRVTGSSSPIATAPPATPTSAPSTSTITSRPAAVRCGSTTAAPCARMATRPWR